MPKSALLSINVDHGGGRVSADLGTLSNELYASGVELLPGERADVGAATGAASTSSAGSAAVEGFARSRELFDCELAWLTSEEAGGLSHGELEERLQVNAREPRQLAVKQLPRANEPLGRSRIGR